MSNLKLLLAMRRFMKLMCIAWAKYKGYPIPPNADEGVRKRNKREHG